MNSPDSVTPEKTVKKSPAGVVTRAEFLNLFSAIFLPMFMAAIDQTLLATATPAIAQSLGGLRDSSWIVSAYLLASATIVPVYGRLGDARGKRNMIMVALGVFTLGSVACSAAHSMTQLVAARVLQGLGGGGLMSLSHALIGELVPPVERVRFQGYFALLFVTASVMGPVVGGVVVSHVSWRWLFLANVPLAAFAALRLSHLPKGERHPRPGGADIPGHILFAVGAVSALFWLTSGGHRFPWLSTFSVAIATVSAVSLTALFLHERRHAAPFLPIDLFGDRTIRLSVVLVLFFAATLFSVIFFLPIYLQLGHGATAQVSGLLLLPVTAGQASAAMLATRILRRTGDPHFIPVGGMATTCVSLLLLGVLPPHMGIVIVLGFFAGLGLGTVMPINQVVVQTVAGRSRLGTVTATLSLARSTGGAAGAALMGALVFALMPHADRQSLLHAAALDIDGVIRAFHHAFVCVAVIAGLGSLTAHRIPRITLWEAATAKA